MNTPSTPWVVGLTGGIGSGKSTVAHYFKKLGVPIIDTDELGRAIVQPNTPTLGAIVKHFGPHILLPNKQLNRLALRKCIFKHIEQRKWLENLLHPLIRESLAKEIASVNTPYCIAVIPLLAEHYPHPLVHHVLVVDTPETLQKQRTAARDHCSEEAAQEIIRNQIKREARLRCANDIITNDKDRAYLKKQVGQLHEKYSQISEKRIQL